MAGTFGAPVASVLLAVELLLFEYRARSLIPVSLAAATATGVRLVFEGSQPIFPMGAIASPGGSAIASYILLGAVIGLAAVVITRALYRVEEAFERLPVHWMWWPALGAIVVGLVGWIAPRTLGVGYDNIAATLNGTLTGSALLVLVGFKLLSWLVALGSGTSGGTLAPLFTIGGGLGALLGAVAVAAFPGLGIDVRIAALVGMAAIFAGASRALLTSVVFAFEATRQPLGLLPLLAGCSGAYLVSLLLMEHSIMTERLSRRGAPVRQDFAMDHLEQVLVRDIASSQVVTLRDTETVESVRGRILDRSQGLIHQGYPVIDARNEMIGVITLKNLLDQRHDPTTLLREIITRSPVVILEDQTAREAADQMVRAGVGRLPVVQRGNVRVVTGMVTRSNLLEAHKQRLNQEDESQRHLSFSVRRGFERRDG